MEYFLSHIVYILVAAGFIGVLAVIWAYASQHNANNRSPEMQEKQDHACESCSLASMCSRMGKAKEGEPCLEKEEKPAGLRLIK